MVEIDVHGRLVLLTSCDFVGVHNGKNVQKAGGHQKLGAVIGGMTSLIGGRIAKKGCKEVQQTRRGITDKAAILNQLGKHIAAPGNLGSGGEGSRSIHFKSITA